MSKHIISAAWTVKRTYLKKFGRNFSKGTMKLREIKFLKKAYAFISQKTGEISTAETNRAHDIS